MLSRRLLHLWRPSVVREIAFSAPATLNYRNLHLTRNELAKSENKLIIMQKKAETKEIRKKVKELYTSSKDGHVAAAEFILQYSAKDEINNALVDLFKTMFAAGKFEEAAQLLINVQKQGVFMPADV